VTEKEPGESNQCPKKKRNSTTRENHGRHKRHGTTNSRKKEGKVLAGEGGGGITIRSEAREPPGVNSPQSTASQRQNLNKTNRKSEPFPEERGKKHFPKDLSTTQVLLLKKIKKKTILRGGGGGTQSSEKGKGPWGRVFHRGTRDKGIWYVQLREGNFHRHRFRRPYGGRNRKSTCIEGWGKKGKLAEGE